MILITGAGGFVGSHLLEQVVSEGIPARVLIRRPIPYNIPMPGVEQAYCDLRTGQGLQEALRDIDSIIHVAGVTKALRAQDYQEGNVQATENLAKAAQGSGIRFVYVSSLAASGPGTSCDEDVAPHPVSIYGRSKLAAEIAVRRFLPQAVIIRPPVVYGPRDTDVFQIFRSVSQGFTFEIAGGDRWFSSIYVKDLAAGLLLAARCPQAEGRTYFLAHPAPATWKHLTATATHVMNVRPPFVLRLPYALAYATGFCGEVWSRFAGRPIIISRDKVAEARFPSWTCDSGRALRELGFEARTGLEIGVAKTLSWYKEAGWLRY